VNIENRKLIRFIVNVKVFDLDTGECLGYSANMHTQGMKLASVEKKLPLSQQYKLKLEYMGVDDELVEIHLLAQSRWSQPGNNPDFCNYGFRFINTTLEQTRELEILIRTLGAGIQPE